MWGQFIGTNGFLQLHSGIEIPSDSAAAKEGFLRTALGYTLSQDQGFGRAWSPMMEVIVAKPEGGSTEWDLVPQVQVSLSKLQHILAQCWRACAAQRTRGSQAAGPDLLSVGLVRRRSLRLLEIAGTARCQSTDSCCWPACSGCVSFVASPSAEGRRADLEARGATRTRICRSSRTPTTACPATTTWTTPVRRGRVDRRDVAVNDDGQRGAGSVLARRRAPRNDRSPDACRGDPGRVRRLPHADGPEDRAGGRAARARSSRNLPIARANPSALHRLAADGISCTVCHQIAPDNLGTRDSFNANFILLPTPADGARVIFGPYRIDAGRQDDHAVGDRIRAGRGSAHPAVRALRVLPHADHPGLRSRRRSDRLAPGADELPGVAAQRLQQGGAELPVVPHARQRQGPIRVVVGAR